MARGRLGGVRPRHARTDIAGAELVSRGGADTFHGRVGASQIGPLGIAAIASEAQTVERTAADVRRRAGDVFFLNMPLRGRFRRGLRAATAASAVAGGALRPFFNGAGAGAGIDKAMARPLAERLVALIALSLGGGAPASGSGAALTQAALDEIERSLGDPELSPASVGARPPDDRRDRLAQRLHRPLVPGPRLPSRLRGQPGRAPPRRAATPLAHAVQLMTS